MAELARFVRHGSVVYSYLSVADSLQVYSRTVLRSCGKMRKRGHLCTSTPNPPGVVVINVPLIS